MLRAFFFLLLLSLSSLAECKLPALAPRDVRSKIEEILKSHVSYSTLTPELMGRALQNFCDELDPTKTYFLEGEIQTWLSPSPETLQKALHGVGKADFSVFLSLHNQFVTAIERREKIEAGILSKQMPKDVKNEEFKEVSWAATEEELSERILRIRALQLGAGQKMGEEPEKFLRHIEKRRAHREAELGGGTEPLRVVLTYALKAITAALDAHTNYFTPSEAGQFMMKVQQRLFGIGAQLRDDLDGLAIVRILENSPASQSGKLHINDKIIAVDHEPVIGLDFTEAVELIRGEQGTPVVLTVLRTSEETTERKLEKLEIELIRNEVVLEESRLESSLEPYGDGSIAILRLYSFYQDLKNSSAIDMRKVIETAKKEQHLKGVLVDLRGNAGGLLSQAVSVTGLFIHKGIVVSIKDNTGNVQHLRETEGQPVWEGPLFILVNRASASAAEIVAQTLQDYGRAVVIGDDHTFGKGSFQTCTFDPINHPKVNPQGEYKVTRGKYYTVSGKTPQLTGVLSDIVIPGLLSELEIGEVFSKFPLENDEIEPHFDDDLSDVSPFHRLQLGIHYKQHLQQKLSTYVPHLAHLKKNSQQRVQSNKIYQTFLQELKKKNYDAPQIDLFNQADLQLTEALNILKDYLFLSEKAS
jgi:carboxyl-terminal processing protease